MENNIINTLKDGERVTSTYAEIYFDDAFCDSKIESSDDTNFNKLKPITDSDEGAGSMWVSPSDLLIGIVDLEPPFTSKITRGKTHEGILAIGEEVLAGEREQFMKHLTTLINENDSAWNYILRDEKASVVKKVKELYDKIFMDKRDIMTQEMVKFYEKSLKELESHLKIEVDEVLMSTHASIISKLNTEIKDKLNKEKVVLEGILKKRYHSEVGKIKQYYKLLLRNELLRYNGFVNKVITERNDAIQAFYRQIESENVTSTMYVMCTERKKCRIKQFMLENYQTLEMSEKLQKLKQKQDVLDTLKKREIRVSHINKEWEDKVKNILQLFLKFISFSLKLLPEQTSFLLDFEKMVVLQLNEIQKNPGMPSSILIDLEKINNTFEFEKKEEQKEECTKEPFEIIGDLAPTPPPQFGSRETLPDDVDLPVVRLQRQFVYAKCHHYEEIKAVLEAQRCKCQNFGVEQPSESISSVSSPIQKSEESIKTESSYEHLLLDDIHRLNDCPVRGCVDWIKKSSFPYLQSYLDFDDEKYERVLTILGKVTKKGARPILIDPKDMVYRELPFAPTKEPRRTVETQYSSQEDLHEIPCSCTDDYIPVKGSSHKLTKSPSKILIENMAKRKTSLRRMLQENPNLLKMFTDESFDFIF